MKFLRIIIILAVIFLIYQNYQTITHLNLTEALKTKIEIISAINILAGLFAGMLIIFPSYKTADNKLKEYKRKLEKTAVNADSGSSKVSVLEAKIEVLEKALKSALDKND